MDEQREIVIGQEMADARANDERRLGSDPLPSPLPVGRYDHERGELGLFDITRVPLDGQLTVFVRRYRDATRGERAGLRGGIGFDDAYTLLAYARRSAVFAMRTGDATAVAEGLGACAAIPYERIDARDGIVAMALLHRAGRHCGADSTVLFEVARELGEPAFSEHIDAFLARPESEWDLRAAWGYVEAEGPQGTGLLGWGYGPWTPSMDLTAVVLRVAEALRGDEYVIETPLLASALPLVWLSAAGDADLEATLEQVRAGAVIHGRLRPEAAVEPGSQQLTTWVLETARPDDAANLARLARRPRPGDALLGLASGSLFVLVVARSVVVGIPSYEDGHRLGRFEPRLRAVISSGLRVPTTEEQRRPRAGSSHGD
jgi:hypothetical protein